MRLFRAAEIIADGIEKKLRYYDPLPEHWRCLRTNNPVERLMREIWRRTRVAPGWPHSAYACGRPPAACRSNQAGHETFPPDESPGLVIFCWPIDVFLSGPNRGCIALDRQGECRGAQPVATFALPRSLVKTPDARSAEIGRSYLEGCDRPTRSRASTMCSSIARLASSGFRSRIAA